MIVLDTHAWLWWVAAPRRLSKAARDAISSAGSVGVSPLSCWEVAMLVRRGRIRLDRDVATWVRQALGVEGVQVLGLAPAAAVVAGELPDHFAGDPIDRLLYATARHLRAPLVTKDRRLRDFDRRLTVW